MLWTGENNLGHQVKYTIPSSPVLENEQSFHPVVSRPVWSEGEKSRIAGAYKESLP